MPELPEVEVVRRGLADHVEGRRLSAVELRGARVARRHVLGPEDLAGRLAGRQVSAARRRGKYLWLDLVDADAAGTADAALLLHLGMSGQLLVEHAEAPDEKHLHARFTFDDDLDAAGIVWVSESRAGFQKSAPPELGFGFPIQ
mgnify:CR=1 FL=1